MFFYSKSTKGFYTEDIHGNDIPEDVVEVSLEEHKELMDGQANGKKIVPDETGNPILIDFVPSPEDIAEQENRNAIKQSALNKLMALGLSEQEALSIGVIK